MNYLKIANPAWANYRGTIGTVEFVDGVSAYPVPRPIADRVSAAMEMIEVDADGKEVRPAGGAHRLISESKNRAPVAEKLKTVSQAELDAEQRAYAAQSAKSPVAKFYKAEDLERIASKGGIKALREIGDPWGVKGKAINNLIEEILAAQDAWIKERDARLARTVEREQKPAPTPEQIDPSLKEVLRIAGETDEEFAERKEAAAKAAEAATADEEPAATADEEPADPAPSGEEASENEVPEQGEPSSDEDAGEAEASEEESASEEQEDASADETGQDEVDQDKGSN